MHKWHIMNTSGQTSIMVELNGVFLEHHQLLSIIQDFVAYAAHHHTSNTKMTQHLPSWHNMSLHGRTYLLDGATCSWMAQDAPRWRNMFLDGATSSYLVQLQHGWHNMLLHVAPSCSKLLQTTFKTIRSFGT